jgi:hypothetical protein
LPDLSAGRSAEQARIRRIVRLREPVAVAAGGGLAVAYVGTVDPNEPGHYPACPFLALTGLYCPGCGALRTVHALVHLDVATALSLNVLVIAAIPLLAAFWLGWVRRRWTGEPAPWLTPGWMLWGLPVLVLGFAVVRNLPGFEALAP